jgi:sulfur-oxidizing protein SoxY
MSMNRRKALQATGGLGALGMFVAAGVISPGEARAAQAAARNAAAFDAKDLNGVIRAFGGEAAAVSDRITITGPDIAENGAVVPVGVTTTLANVQMIALLVEKNPAPLAAVFMTTPEMEPFVATRVKMGQTSDVYALVRADGRLHIARREIKVTLGGCGG